MPEYEGLVAGLKPNGRAEVVIRPGSSGIPGAGGDVNTRVCHCTSDGSSLTVEALNCVGADVGDRVMVTLCGGALFRNTMAVIGSPLAGLGVGLVLAWFITNGFSVNTTVGILVSAAGLVPGIILAVILFRRLSAENVPAIERIIMTRLEASSRMNDRSVLRNAPEDCQGCTGPVF